MTRFALALLCMSASAASAGSVKGTVLYEGEPPVQETLKRDSDPKCSKDKTDEAVVVNKGKLRDVVVRIKNGTAGKHTAPAATVLLDQKDCMYTPRVVGIVAGQKLLVRNSDNTFHNVWGQVAAKDVFNKPQGPKAADLTLDPSAAKADDIVELKCGVHGWMHAYVAVQDHPLRHVHWIGGSQVALRQVVPAEDHLPEAALLAEQRVNLQPRLSDSEVVPVVADIEEGMGRLLQFDDALDHRRLLDRQVLGNED